ncbi:MAG: acyl-CoA desaturase [Cypionkella sp.]|uniref:acyl-CoA desaturase n=1 Tax=Cypionkella sp. TaxID=2811411 RepID=UPI002ABBF33B|nr:acyl-CoA desaturase [Cypionkella sp.]MDZ4311802.1 acyl-CoA desaturase [Cypionkella sp.]
MAHLVSTDRFHVTAETSALQGRVRCLPVKTLWLFGHGLAGITGVLLYPQLDALLVFLGLTAVTICAGHSVGMHRLLIHRSFETPRVVEYTFVWLGTLVSMAGPIGMIRTHDLRDWHQRQTECPPHPAHQAAFWRDAWWQLCCEFRLDHPPEFVLEDRVGQDRTYRFIEKTWMWQQLPVALLLYAFGGWAWVLWGCSLRIFVSLVGHWLVGHFSHRRGHQGWRISGLPVQGYNIPGISLLTFGENWHGNHHAFPHSAKLGVERGQLDPGYYFIWVLQKLGLVWNVKTPDSEPPRKGLQRV